VAGAIAQYQWLLEGDPALAALFLPGGKPLAAGDLLRQPALAETLRGIADGGADAFYCGRAAESLSRTCEMRGGLLRRADFQRYRPDWVEPLETRYRDVTVRVMPPNSFGLLLLLQLHVLQGFDLSSLPVASASRYSLLMGAAGAAFREGRRAIADPACNSLPVVALLGREATERMRAAAGEVPAAGNFSNQGGTAIVSAADAAGNGVTLVQSVFLPFGSGVADSETGVLLNNRMTGFSTDPGDPNCVAPSKRPAHTLCPAMALQGERLRFLLGSPGGPGQTLTLAQVLSNLLDLNMDVSEAVEAPRWSMNLEGNAILETSIGEETLAQLRRLGHRVERGSAGALYFGSAEVIEVLPGGALCAAADWRRDASAVGA
jgi:gamma-glutamyltranspeptidase/glutathione hydrolase